MRLFFHFLIGISFHFISFSLLFYCFAFFSILFFSIPFYSFLFYLSLFCSQSTIGFLPIFFLLQNLYWFFKTFYLEATFISKETIRAWYGIIKIFDLQDVLQTSRQSWTRWDIGCLTFFVLLPTSLHEFHH